MTKKLKLVKDNELAVTLEDSQCDFCGGGDGKCFTSSWDEPCNKCPGKCVMQICEDCVRQLFKLIK